MLSKSAPTGNYAGPNRRRGRRRTVRIPVRFKLRSLPVSYDGLLEDVSLVGVRMSTGARLKVGEEISIQLPSGSDHKLIVFRAAIVRAVQAGSSRQAGMVFVELSPAQHERLARLVARAEP